MGQTTSAEPRRKEGLPDSHSFLCYQTVRNREKNERHQATRQATRALEHPKKMGRVIEFWSWRLISPKGSKHRKKEGTLWEGDQRASCT